MSIKITKFVDLRTKDMFLLALASISLIGIFATSIQIIWQLAFDSVIDLSVYVSAVILIILGIGLVIEGNIKALIERKRRIDATTIAKLFTSFFGMVVFAIGILSFPIFGLTTSVILLFVKLLINIFVIIVILYEILLVR